MFVNFLFSIQSGQLKSAAGSVRPVSRWFWFVGWLFGAWDLLKNSRFKLCVRLFLKHTYPLYNIPQDADRRLQYKPRSQFFYLLLYFFLYFFLFYFSQPHKVCFYSTRGFEVLLSFRSELLCSESYLDVNTPEAGCAICFHALKIK